MPVAATPIKVWKFTTAARGPGAVEAVELERASGDSVQLALQLGDVATGEPAVSVEAGTVVVVAAPRSRPRGTGARPWSTP